MRPISGASARRFGTMPTAAGSPATGQAPAMAGSHHVLADRRERRFRIGFKLVAPFRNSSSGFRRLL